MIIDMVNEWISVRDRLPDTRDDYWVCYLYNDKQYITQGNCSLLGGGPRWSDVYGADDGLGDDGIYGVTHWMKIDIPEPPKAPLTSDHT